MKNALLFLLIFGLSYLQTFAQDLNWPMVNGGSFLSSYAESETELKPPLKVVGSIATEAAEYAFLDNLLVVGQSGTPNKVIAFNWLTGAELWSFEIPNTAGSIGCVPAITENLVLCGGQRSEGLYALNKEDGTIAWQKDIGTLYTRNPVVYGDKVYIIQDKIYCLNLADGSEVWTYPYSGQFTPAVDESNVYVSGGGGVVLDKLTGQKKYDLISSDGNMVIDEDKIYINSGLNIIALKKSDGSTAWEVPRLGGALPFLNGGAFAVSDKYFCYVLWKNNDQKGEVYVLNKSNGSTQWHYTFEDEGAFTPRIANGVVYVLNWKPGGVWGFDISDGSVLFNDPESVSSSPPIIADHSLLVNYDTELKILKSNATSVNDDGLSNPTAFKLGNNYPNPFSKGNGGNSTTTIEYSVGSANSASPLFVSLKVYDILGKEVATLVNKEQAPGNYSVRFSAGDLSAGIYFYKLEINNFRSTKKMIILN